MLINDTVNVDVPEEPDLDKLVLKRFKHLVSELRELCNHEHGSHLASRSANLSRHELLVLNIYFPSSCEAIAAHVATYRKLDAGDEVLEDERVLDLPSLVPLTEHEEHILGALGAVRQGLVGVPTRFAYQAGSVALLDVRDCLLI